MACVRTVRIGLGIGFQRVGADGVSRSRPLNRPRRCRPSASPATRSRCRNWPSADRRTVRTMRTVASLGFLAKAGLPVVVMRIIRVRARPSRSKPMSMPILRRKVAARRKPARQRPRAIGPGLRLGDALARHFGKGAQKLRGGSRPLRPRGHHGAHGGGDRIGVDHAFHRLVAVAAIGRPEGARRPERGFAGRRPQARSPPCAAACRAWCAAIRPGPSPPRRAARRGCAGARPRTPPTIPASGRRRSSGIGSSVRNTARSARSGRVTISSIPFRITGRAASNSTSS